MKPIEEIDRNFALNQKTEDGLIYYVVWQPPFGVWGLIPNAKNSFCRFPLEVLPRLPETVQSLAWHTAGACVRFSTDAPSIAVKWRLAAQQTSEAIIADAQKKAAAILNEAEASVQGKASSLEQDFTVEQQRLSQARATAQAFIAAVELDVQKHLSQLEALRQLSAPAAAEPAPAPAQEPKQKAESAEEDLAARIGSAVQEIAAEDPSKGRNSGVRFEDLQFGKDYSFSN